MMRIALVSQEYPPETGHGGIATQTYTKAHGLADLGHEVYVISHSLDSARHEYETSGVRVIRIPGFDGELPLYTEIARWITYSALVASEISALDSQVELDLVDFAEWGSEGYVHLVNSTSWGRIPTVIQTTWSPRDVCRGHRLARKGFRPLPHRNSHGAYVPGTRRCRLFVESLFGSLVRRPLRPGCRGDRGPSHGRGR